MTEPRLYPGLLAAGWLTLLGWLFMGLTSQLALTWLPPTAAAGVGVTFGLGAAGALGAARIPPPHAERIGLRSPARRHLLLLLLLLPSVLLASEVDNCLRALLPPAEVSEIARRVPEALGDATPLAVAENLVVAAGLAPLVEEWFFRGILQQGLVAQLGPAGGIAGTAALFAIAHGGPGLPAADWLALAGAAFAHGLLLGAVRWWSGSLFAALLLHAGINVSQILALIWASRAPLAGFNAPGAHTPIGVLLLAAASVGAGLFFLARTAPPSSPPASS